MPAEAVNQLLTGGASASAADADVEVWPDHQDAVSLFIALDRQWRVVPTANSLIYAGLDYVAARELASWMGLDVSPDLLMQLRELEAEAMPLRNAR